MLVKDRAASGIGASTLPRVWHSIDWKATAHRVRNLRRRIYRASQLQQPNRVRSLMKLMLRSRANLYAAVRRVTQDNPGKRTPGVDGQLARTATERDQLIQQMGRYTLGRVKPTRRIYIPKRNGKTRPLAFPVWSTEWLKRWSKMRLNQAGKRGLSPTVMASVLDEARMMPFSIPGRVYVQVASAPGFWMPISKARLTKSAIRF